MIAEVDPRRVERILRNLIANAIDHAEHKPVRIRMGADEDTVAVTVRDYGVGLRPGEEKLVFSRFWRSDPSRVRRSGGTGLGLAISVEDARLHQGRLEAWGEPGKGACFRLTLPLVRGHKVTTSPLPMKPIPQPVRSPARPARNTPRKPRKLSGRASTPRGAGRCGRLTLLRLLPLAVVLAGCAGVPSSSAPQAIGTVERPAPSNLPKPTPGMDPDVLLREFLKATADPANRHLAARQFLTQSASNAWDDAGSALLIDHVVFVETRAAERVSATMRADILGSLSDMGVFETAEGVLPDPGPIELVKTSGRLAHRPAAQRGLPGLAAVPGHLQAQHAVLRRPDRQDGGSRSALRRGVRPRSVGHRAGLQADGRAAARDGPHASATCSPRRCGCAGR